MSTKKRKVAQRQQADNRTPIIVGAAVVGLVVVAAAIFLLVPRQDAAKARPEPTAIPIPTSVAAGGKPTVSAAAQPPSQPKQWSSPPAMSIEPNKTYVATFETSKGAIQAELFAKEAPKTVNNFVFLARQGFYDGVPFHRIIKGFMVQTGDPTGTGRGGPGYRFEDERVTRDYKRGTLAMANAGPNTNGSQFFIVHQDYPLPKNYTIFGQVTGGLDVLDQIAGVPVGPSETREASRPLETIRINSVAIEER